MGVQYIECKGQKASLVAQKYLYEPLIIEKCELWREKGDIWIISAETGIEFKTVCIFIENGTVTDIFIHIDRDTAFRITNASSDFVTSQCLKAVKDAKDALNNKIKSAIYESGIGDDWFKAEEKPKIKEETEARKEHNKSKKWWCLW